MNTLKELAKRNGPLPPKVDGLGYITDHIQGGVGYSYVRFAHKDLPNGHLVHLLEHFPSPLAGLAGRSTAIRSEYTVYLGQSDREDYCMFPVPDGVPAEAWAPDAEVNWYANFGDDGEAAEAYASERCHVDLWTA